MKDGIGWKVGLQNLIIKNHMLFIIQEEDLGLKSGQDVEFAKEWNEERDLYLEKKFSLIK